MRLILSILFCSLLNSASGQTPRDSVILDGVFIVDCACKVDDIIVVDLSSTSEKNNSYRVYFQKSSKSLRETRLRKSHTIKVNTVVYLYEPEFIGSLYGRLVQFQGTEEVVIRYTKGNQKRRILLGLDYDLLSEFTVKKRCPKSVAHIF
jgi:hypothetical protein